MAQGVRSLFAEQNWFRRVHKNTMQNSIGRRWNRYSANGQVKILSEHEQVKTMSFGRIAQISEGGLAFSCLQPLAVGEPIELEFEIPVSKLAIKLAAIVRNRDGNTYGVEFLQPGPHQKQGLQFACNALSYRNVAA